MVPDDRRAAMLAMGVGVAVLSELLPAAELSRRRAKSLAETAIEIRNFIEPAGVGYLADLETIIPTIFQHRARTLQPELEHALTEGRPGLVEQVLDVSIGHAHAPGELLRGEFRIGETGTYLPDDLVPPR